MTLQQIEAALDAGQLWAKMGNGRTWRCRRNGQTKTWKTRPGEFQIPVKTGFYTCSHVRHDNLYNFEVRT